MPSQSFHLFLDQVVAGMPLIRIVTVVLLLAAADAASAGDGANPAVPRDSSGISVQTPSGALPESGTASGARIRFDPSHNCMKVCKQWGEDCITDSPQGTRRCRRSCQQFGIQCF